MVARRNETNKTNSLARTLAALGHPMRLALVERLSGAETFAGLSITELTEDSGLTRQAVTKHLEILEEAGLVSRLKLGRATWYELRREPLESAMKALSVLVTQRAESERKFKIADKEFQQMLTKVNRSR